MDSKLKVIKGNLLDLAEAGNFNIIVQGCNCFCTMGSGLAREIRERYPEAFRADQLTKSGDYTKLGNSSQCEAGDYADPISYKTRNKYAYDDPKRFTIINAYTQFGFNKGGSNTDVFEYTSFELILQKLGHEYPQGRFGFPRIGQGLAGGDSVTITEMLMNFAEVISITGGSATLVEFSQP